MIATDAPPRVPSQRWFDPALRAMMHTGDEAARAVAAAIDTDPAARWPVAVDTETPGLDRSFTHNCLTLAWWTDGCDGIAAPQPAPVDARGRRERPVTTVLLDPRRDVQHRRLAAAMLARASAVILHNAPFDVPPMVAAGLLTLDDVERVVDTLLLARYATPDVMIPKTLTALAVRLLGVADSKGGLELAFKAAGHRTQAEGFAGMDIGSPVYRYGAMADTVATLRIEPMLRDTALAWSLDHPFVERGATTAAEAEALLATQETVNRVMLRRSARGLTVDLDYLHRYAEQVDSERAVATAELAVHGLDAGVGKGPALVTYLDSRGELPQPWPRTPTGKLRATKADLEVLASVNPLAAAQRRVAVIEKTMGYLDKVAGQAAVTGRCHPQINVLGASATGRMSYGSPELQQFPAEARPILMADDPGVGITSIDWSQIEPVCMGLMAKDEQFLAPYERGDDLYGPLMESCRVDRNTAKVVLLSVMYGSGVGKLAMTISHTEESAAQIRRQMFAAMPVSERWMRKIAGVAETYGRVITAGGRILPVDLDGVFKAVNYTVQGSAYDVLAAAIVELHRRGMSDAIHLAMHDELVVSTDAAAEVREVMDTPPDFLARWAGRTPVLRTDAEDTGAHWAKV